MQARRLGRTARTVSAIGLGTWQLGADWGEVSEAGAQAVLDAAVRGGVTVFDTADALAGEIPQFSAGFGDGVLDLDDRFFRAAVHDRW